MGFSFFNAPKPRRFNYQPRFFDPEMEEWKRKKAEKGLDTDLTEEEKMRIRLRRGWNRTEDDSKKRGYSGFRWIIILFLIVLMVYLIFGTGVIDNLVNGMMTK